MSRLWSGRRWRMMTDDRMALIELVEKQADVGLVREMLAFAAERIMEVEVEVRTGRLWWRSFRKLTGTGSRRAPWTTWSRPWARVGCGKARSAASAPRLPSLNSIGHRAAHPGLRRAAVLCFRAGATRQIRATQ
jgi:hypothetical protein